MTVVRSALTAVDVLGFESPSAWSTSTAGAVLAQSPVHTQGSFSLSVRPSNSNGFTPIVSSPLSNLSGVSPTVAWDLFLPAQQANPYWLGAAQMYLNCPSRGIYSAFLAQVELTGKQVNGWNTLNFPLTNDLISRLVSPGYSDLTITVVVNVAVPTTGTYLVDNLRFVPAAANACGPLPNGTACSDGNVCTTQDTCQGGVCVGAGAASCPASDACHLAGVCDPVTGCVNAVAPDWTPCNDGDHCASGKACQSGVCSGGQPVCDDGDPCTSDSCTPATGACQHISVSSDQCANALASLQPVHGRVTFANGVDINRCVPDALHMLDKMNARGELIGLHYAHAGYTPLDSQTFHTQTIVRLPYVGGTSNLNGQYFLSNFDHETCSQNLFCSLGIDPNDDNFGSQLGIAVMGFKGGKDGKMLGSNRSFNNNWTGPTGQWNVTPNPADTFIPIGTPPTSHFKMDPLQNHPGGASALGSHAATALQGWDAAGGFLGLSGATPDDSQPIVQIYDVADPTNPQLRSVFLTRINGNGTDNQSVAITKLTSGKFLLAVVKGSPVGQVEFYVSTGTSLDDQNPFGTNGRDPDAIWHQGVGWQNMLGFNKDTSLHGAVDGDDWVVSYKVNLTFGGGSATYQVAPTQIVRKHMYCSDNSDVDQCDMASGTGAYVDPNGQLLLYATNFDGDGGATGFVYGNGNPWFGNSPAFAGYIRGMEYHQRHGNSAPATACPTLADAWVELYADPAFNNGGNTPGQVYRINFPEVDEKDGKDMGSNFFNHKASSVRWCVPAGSSFKMFDGTWSGSSVVLKGTSAVAQMSDLTGMTYPVGGGSLNDSLRSYFFQPGVTDPMALSGDPDTSD